MRGVLPSLALSIKSWSIQWWVREPELVINQLVMNHSCPSFPSLYPDVWMTKRSPSLMWARDSLAITAKAPPFATALTCFASQQNLMTSICTALCSSVSQTTTSPAHLWAHQHFAYLAMKGSVIYRICCLCCYGSSSVFKKTVLFSLQNCNSISKREAVRADPAQGLLSYGPIRIEMPDRPQSSKPVTVSILFPVIVCSGLNCVG